MVESKELLRQFAALVRRLTGAQAVSVYVPAVTRAEHRAILVQEGSPAVPELADAERAAAFVRDAGPAATGEATEEIAAKSPECRLLRIDARSLATALHGDAAAHERRRADDRSITDGEGVWLGLRFDRPQRGPFALPERIAAPEALWERVLGVTASLAEHARAVSHILKDPITGLPGRAEFQVELQRAMIRAERAGSPLTLLLVNPDDFASVNERFGRDAGDTVIREVTEHLRASLRRTDPVSRYGGAIFACLLVDSPLDEAKGIANKILQKLADATYLKGAVRLPFSIGAAEYDSASDHDPLDLVRRSDQALNAAKRRGGGRVQLWKPGEAMEEGGHLDRLAGIFTGNMFKDYRNMVLLWDSVRVVSAGSGFDDLVARMVDRLRSTIGPQRVGIFARGAADEPELLEGLGGSEDDPGQSHRLELGAGELELVRRCLAEGRALSQIRPDSPADSRRSTTRSCFAVPLTARDVTFGALYLDGKTDTVGLDASDLVFLEALGSQMAVALDQARLAEQERARQEREEQRLRAELDDLRQAIQSSKLIYRSKPMEALLATARRVAPTDATVLITGESGTGKEVLARTLHELSQRRNKPLVVVDCGAISATLIDSELFGHERGAFTGAQERKIGRLAEADGATVLLDEIGELPMDVQSKLLRFAQERQLTPVGSSRPREVDVRILAATNVDLAARVAQGKFRQDLFHRLNVVRLQVPPLRERPDDILHLAQHFLAQYSSMYGKAVREFSAEAEGLLIAYDWPGNIRELQNRIMQAVLMGDGPQLGAQAFRSLAGTDPADSVVAGTDAGSAPSRALPAADPGPAGETLPQLIEHLRLCIGREIASATEGNARRPFPLGKWLVDDLLLEADAAANGVARRGAALLGVPETTYRRRLAKAADKAATGIAPRPNTWPAVRDTLARLVRAPDSPALNLLDRVERVMLDEVIARYPDNLKISASLLGITEPTLSRRLA